MNLNGQTILIVGMARSGQAAARLAHQARANVRVTDHADESSVDSGFLKWIGMNKIPAEFGGHSREMVAGCDLVVLSPGVRYDVAPGQWAREQGIAVIGELEFAYRFCPCPVIAVTGSNGKTTVTTLIGRVLREAGRQVFVGGNIGTPLSASVLDLRREHIAVLEVSSFQLESIQTFAPHIGVFLNCSQNHLDRHADMQEYFECKARLFDFQGPEDTALLNAQDPMARSLSSRVRSKVRWFNTDEQKQHQAEENPNFLAVEAVASELGISSEVCQKIFREFTGLEHRLERVADIQGVTFINDSKATTAEAGRWALLRVEAPIVWICGGRDKNLDFGILRPIVKQKVKVILTIGEATEKIIRTFSDLADVRTAADMDDAVRQAWALAQTGEAVLLSPMCASFDMFQNFEHRGSSFKESVRELERCVAKGQR